MKPTTVSGKRQRAGGAGSSNSHSYFDVSIAHRIKRACPISLFRRIACLGVLVAFILAPRPLPLALCFALELPSLFRGVVIADHSFGVRVVSVDEDAQAYQADLRPEDIIIRIDSEEIDSIDRFALISNSLKGKALRARLLIFRNGVPKEIEVHLYSYPVRETWGLDFVPDYDLRFAQSYIAETYWLRMGRGYLEAGNEAQALSSYLNVLHNEPQNITAAVKVAELFSRIGHRRLKERAYAAGITALRQSLAVLQKLFDYPLTEAQMLSIKEQLQETLKTLRELNRDPG